MISAILIITLHKIKICKVIEGNENSTNPFLYISRHRLTRDRARARALIPKS
jgi:hypothetical protein